MQTEQHILINPNMYDYRRAAIDACDLVFHPDKQEPKRIPKEVHASLALINERLR